MSKIKDHSIKSQASQRQLLLNQPPKSTKSQPVSPQFSLYKSTMPPCPFKKQQIYAKLQAEGFNFSDTFSFQFKTQIIKTNDFSVTYLVEYGRLRHILHFYVSKLAFRNQVHRKYLSGGRNACTFQFLYKGTQIVSKVIQVQNQKELISKQILQEIFIMKISSILHTGPKFYNLYGFDAIMTDNRLEFLMEKCIIKKVQTSLQKIELLKNLSVLHQIRLIHGDISLNNIMWSQSQKKHILIDYGLSMFIKQNIGYKSMSCYRGTYRFCSEQMQVAFHAKNSMSVDLYYNDLYGVQKFVENINQRKENNEKKINFINLNITQKDPQKNENLKGSFVFRWQQIVSFFKMNFLAQLQNYQQMLSILKQRCQLPHTFRAITKRAISKINQPAIQQKFSKKLLDINPKPLEIQKADEKDMDSYLYSKFMSAKSLTEEYFSQITLQNIDNIIQMGNFSQYWIKSCHKRQLFNILYLQNRQYQIQKELKAAIVTKKNILSEINAFAQIATTNDLQAFYQTLCIFRNFFYKQEDIRHLTYISEIFELLALFSEIKKTNEMICQIFHKMSKKNRDYLIAAHSMLFRVTYYHFSQFHFWQMLYVNNYLEKSSLSNIEMLFRQLILIHKQNIQEIKGCRQLVDLKNTEEEQIYNKCIHLKNLFLSINQQQQIDKTRKITESDPLYASQASQAYIQFLSVSNFYRTSKTYFFRWQKKYLSLLLKIQSIFFVETIRQADAYAFKQPQKFYRIMTQYFHLLTKYKNLVDVWILLFIISQLLAMIQKKQSSQISQIYELIKKYITLIRLQNWTDNKLQILQLISAIFNIYIAFQKQEMLGNLPNKAYYSKDLYFIQKQLLRTCLEIFQKDQQAHFYVMQIKSFQLLIQLNQTSEPKDIGRIIKMVYKYFDQYSMLEHLTISQLLFIIIGFKHVRKLIPQSETDWITKTYRKHFLNLLKFEKWSGQEIFPIQIVLSVIYRKQEFQFFYQLLINKGETLKANSIYYSSSSVYVVSNLFRDDYQNIMKKKAFASWTLSDVSFDPYKAAFVLRYLQSYKFRQLKRDMQEDSKRLFTMCAIGISTVDFGLQQIRQEAMLWKYIAECFANKKTRKYPIILTELVRRWCRYVRIRQYVQHLIYNDMENYILNRKKIKINITKNFHHKNSAAKVKSIMKKKIVLLKKTLQIHQKRQFTYSFLKK